MDLFQHWDNLPVIHLETMDRKIFTGKNIMLVQNSVHPHAVVPAHKHPHEQLLYVLSGECDVTTEGTTKHLTAGGLAFFASNAEHAVTNTEDVPLLALDIFHPIREDFLSLK